MTGRRWLTRKAVQLQSVFERFGRATSDNWIRVVIGAATGMYVAVALCLAIVLAVEEYGYPIGDYTLSFVLDGILIASPYLGAIVGYRTRRAPAERAGA